MGNRTQEFGEDQEAKYTKDAETLVDCLTNPENENYEPENHRYTFYAAQSWFDAQDWPSLHRWLESILASDLFLKVMPKYSRWQSGNEKTRFPQEV